MIKPYSSNQVGTSGSRFQLFKKKVLTFRTFERKKKTLRNKISWREHRKKEKSVWYYLKWIKQVYIFIWGRLSSSIIDIISWIVTSPPWGDTSTGFGPCADFFSTQVLPKFFWRGCQEPEAFNPSRSGWRQIRVWMRMQPTIDLVPLPVPCWSVGHADVSYPKWKNVGRSLSNIQG